MMSLTRRGLFFCTATALIFWRGLRPVAARTIDNDGFLALSKKLLQRDDLDPDAAASFLKGFLAMGNGAALDALAAGQTQPELEEQILTAWYSGVSPDPSDPDAVTYESALVWQAMSYTKAPGTCTAEDWSKAPAL